LTDDPEFVPASELRTDGGPQIRRHDYWETVADDAPKHRAVDGGFECDDCGATRQTPLGISRHREMCNGGEAGGE